MSRPSSHEARKNPENDRARAFARRALFAGTVQAGLFSLLGARLAYLQLFDAEQYVTLAEDNRINQRLLIPERGRIFDRFGRPLAINTPTYRLRMVPEQAPDPQAVLDRLAAIIDLSPRQREDALAEMRVRRSFIPVSLREDLTWDEVARVSIQAPELPGIILDSAQRRFYPEGEMLAHLLGYLGPANEREQEAGDDPLLNLPDFRLGKNGVERISDLKLRGSAGQSRVEVNALGREIRELQRDPGVPGEDVRLTLDLELQRFVHERLSQELSATAIVMDVTDGAILALSSVPAFAPEDFANGISQRKWSELLNNPRTPLVNKAIAGTYPPGSTFKMLTALAALEAGVVNPSYQAYCPGHMSLGRSRFHCWKRGGHGRLNMRQAIERSCDVYFYDIARKVGVDKIAEIANRFGLGGTTGIDLPGEKGGLIPTRAWKRSTFDDIWHPGETLVIGIGQGYVSATPLQLATMTARLANGRLAVTPWLGTPPTEPFAPLTVNPAHLDVVREGMHMVVYGERGTARRAKVSLEGVELAGKTGTSQVKRITAADRASGRYKRDDIPWRERDHALFVAFAPYINPRYAVTVVVEHGESGSRTASPIARDIMDKTLRLNPARHSITTAALDQPR